MISVILFFLLLCSGSVLASAFRGRRFEEVLPLTCAGIVLILYVCGLLGALALGAALVCVLAVCAYIASAARLFRTGGWGKFRRDFFSLPLWLFALLYLFLIYCHHGRLAVWRDEFSHWIYIVKAMASLDDFGVNPLAHSAFASYPPGMALFQYMLEKLCQWTDHIPMSEWHCYVAYQALMFSMVWPFTRGLTLRKPISLAASCGLVFLCPTVFYRQAYTCGQVEPFLGVLFGAGLAMLFLQKRWDALPSAQLFALCAMLVLAKDAGILLAVFLAAGYCLTLWLCDGPGENGTVSRRGKLLRSLAAALAVALPWGSWRWLLKAKKITPAFSAPYDPARILKVVTGRDTSPRANIWRDFFSVFAARPVPLGDLGVSVSFLCILAVLGAALILLTAVLLKKGRISRKRALAALSLTATAVFAYTLGLCFTYIVRFTDAEAVRLAEFSRYEGVPFLGMLCLAALLTVTLLPVVRFQRTAAAAALAAALCLSPYKSLYSLAARNSVAFTHGERAVLEPLVRQVETYAPEDARIWFIHQEFEAHYCWMMRFSAFPREVPYDVAWSLGEEPFFPGDLWTYSLSPEKWRETLAESYDYVALFQLNDYFYENYASVFANPGDIAENTLYRVNKDTGLLEKCGL